MKIPPLPDGNFYCYGDTTFEGGTLVCRRREQCLRYRAWKNSHAVPIHTSPGIASHACTTYHWHSEARTYTVDEFWPIPGASIMEPGA